MIECGTNLEHIFDDLEYYNSKKKQLGSRYNVVFKKELQSTIRVSDKKNKPDLVMIIKTTGVKEEYVAGVTNNRKRLLTRR